MIGTRRFVSLAAGFLLVALCSTAIAGELQTIQLPAPQRDGGKPLMVALKDRQSMRSFSKQKLSEQTLSNLLWAAFGINRPETSGRTAPSAMNMQEIEIYVALEQGLYFYDAKENLLKGIVDKDLREATGMQDFVKMAPLNLVFVVNTAKLNQKISKEVANEYAAMDVGYISQNVYLFCASEGLATVARAYVNKEALAEAMKLPQDQKVILAQTVGYPK